jgi:TonB family protein
VAVPLDVVVLRSGIPSTIPGRSVDVGEGGVSAVLSGELLPGEPVGVQFKLPFVIDPVHAKAQVRYYGPFRCGLQFLAMRPEQQGALRTWARMAGESGRTVPKHEPEPQAPPPVPVSRPAIEQPETRVRREQPRQLRWGWISLTLVVFAAAAVAVWWLPPNWWERYRTTNAATSQPPAPIKLAGAVMAQRLLHRVEPQYPLEAEKSKLQGLVVLDTVIGSDGSVKEIRAVSGPDILVQAATDAVRWWRFQPYEVDGHPVPVETTIEVDFQLPR